MMTRTLSATPWGVNARPVDVEVDVRFGLPRWTLVGLPDTALRESRDRVKSAIRNSGFELEQRVVTVNLAPADLRKEGSHLELAIALGLLASYKMLPADALRQRMFCGELALDGKVRAVSATLQIAELAERKQVTELIVPREVEAQARALAAVRSLPFRIVAVSSLLEATEHLRGRTRDDAATSTTGSVFTKSRKSPCDPEPDLRDVRGQDLARRALEVAAAGGHNLMMSGPPGTGKTMLARRLPGLLPSLEASEAIEITKIHSVASPLPGHGLLRSRPFRAPHSTASTAALLGGGPVPRPGEVSLAHGGVLFLDELPEFRRDALEALRQPLEDGTVTVSRARAQLTYPARFSLVAAMNPCPCGFQGDPRHDCRCTPAALESYQRRISGPLLDRIDLHVEVPAVSVEELRADSPGREPSSRVAARVREARTRQRARFPRDHPTPFNAALPVTRLDEACRAHLDAWVLLERAYQRWSLSPRAIDRARRVARTLADLEGEDRVGKHHVAEALRYRVDSGSSRTD